MAARSRTGTRSRSRRGNTIKVSLKGYDPDGPDFDGGGGGFVIPPGIYPMKCESAEQKVSKNDNDMIEWIFTGNGGKAKGKKFFLHTVLDQAQKLGKTFTAVGLEFDPDDEEFEFDPDEVEGAECFGEVYTDEYNGEKRSKLRRVMADEEEAEAEEEDERPARSSRKSRGNGKSTSRVKLSEDEVKDMGEEELEELVSKHDLDVDLSKFKVLTKKVNATIDALADKGLIS